MNTLKILDFRAGEPFFLFKFLQFAANKKNLSWSFAHYQEFDKELLAEAQVVFIDPVLSAQLRPLFPVVPTQVRGVEIFDSLFLEHKLWLPRLLLHESLRQVLVTRARDLDNRAPAYVIGDNGIMRVVASVLAEMGFVDIYLVGDLAQLEEPQRVLSRSQLGIRFHKLAPEELTMQATSAAIVVNTTDLEKDKVLLTDLSYFNFMKQGGYALDLATDVQPNPLLEEAERADLRILSNEEVKRLMIRLCHEQMKVSDAISVEELVELWPAFLQENPPSV